MYKCVYRYLDTCVILDVVVKGDRHLMKIRKANADEKQAYRGIYPLFGYVVIGAHTVPVEYLGEGKGEPNYEAILPDGMHLICAEIHTVLGTTQRDLLDRLTAGIEECNEYCRELNGPREIA